MLVQNWNGSGAPTDMATLSVAVVAADEGNLLVQGPAQQPQLDPFDITVLFDEPALETGDRAYGVLTIGTSPASPGGLTVSRCTASTAWVRFVTCILRKIAVTCALIVASETPSW